MVDTALSSLAQNLDGIEWPFSGSDEKPSTYLDYTYRELQAEFEGRGKPSAADLLTQILRETLSFDEPFGEMVKQTEVSSQRENPMLKTLSRLSIPENFPLALAKLDESTRDLCRMEQVETIGQFAIFAQNVSKNVIVEGDFRELLNGLAHMDEKTLACFVPLRPGAPGVHLMEAFVLASFAKDPVSQAGEAVAWFRTEAENWRRQAVLDRRFLERQLLAISDPALQERVAQLIVPHFVTDVPRVSGWAKFKRLFKT